MDRRKPIRIDTSRPPCVEKHHTNHYSTNQTQQNAQLHQPLRQQHLNLNLNPYCTHFSNHTTSAGLNKYGSRGPSPTYNSSLPSSTNSSAKSTSIQYPITPDSPIAQATSEALFEQYAIQQNVLFCHHSRQQRLISQEHEHYFSSVETQNEPPSRYLGNAGHSICQHRPNSVIYHQDTQHLSFSRSQSLPSVQYIQHHNQPQQQNSFQHTYKPKINAPTNTIVQSSKPGNITSNISNITKHNTNEIENTKRQNNQHQTNKKRAVDYLEFSEFSSLFIYDTWFYDQPESENAVEQDKFARFINHVLYRSQVSEEIGHLVLYYIHELKTKCRKTKQILGSEYPLFIACIAIANKCLDDNAYLNSVWSKVGRVPLDIVNQVEREVLDTLDYKSHLSPLEYCKWKLHLEYS